MNLKADVKGRKVRKKYGRQKALNTRITVIQKVSHYNKYKHTKRTKQYSNSQFGYFKNLCMAYLQESQQKNMKVVKNCT